MTRGSGVSSIHNLRSGRSVRTVSQAMGSAMASESTVTQKASQAVRARISRWAGRSSSAHTDSFPLKTRKRRYAMGSRIATAAMAARIHSKAKARRLGLDAQARRTPSPLLRISDLASTSIGPGRHHLRDHSHLLKQSRGAFQICKITHGDIGGIELREWREQIGGDDAFNQRVFESLAGEILLRNLGQHEFQEALSVFLVPPVGQNASPRNHHKGTRATFGHVVIASRETLSFFGEEAIQVVVIYQTCIHFTGANRRHNGGVVFIVHRMIRQDPFK